nr:hypothetical protein [Staphylococcus hominis]
MYGLKEVIEEEVVNLDDKLEVAWVVVKYEMVCLVVMLMREGKWIVIDELMFYVVEEEIVCDGEYEWLQRLTVDVVKVNWRSWQVIWH